MRSISTRIAVDALRLRRFGLDCLGGGGAEAPPESASAEAWRVFLGTERCALALTRRLTARGALPDASSVAGTELRRAALGESQRVLRARAQVDELERVARERSRPLCLLKGGALVGDAAVDLLDLDVLLDERDVAEVGAALRLVGWVVQDPYTQGEAAFPASGPLPVELHVASEEKVALLDGEALERVRALSGHAALAVLAPADQLWNLLCHVARSHLNRQGNLRDLLVSSSAVAECTADDLRLVDGRIDDQRDRAALRRSLDFALAFAGGNSAADPFEEIAAVNYLLASRMGRTGARPDLNPAFALLSPGPERRLALTRSWLDAPPSPRPALRRLRRRAPRVERVVRSVAACVRLAGAVVLAGLAPVLVLASRRDRRLATS